MLDNYGAIGYKSSAPTRLPTRGRAHPTMHISLLTLHLSIPGCTSLKEKRSRIKPLLARLHREFNVSAAEVGRLDAWDETLIACALVSNDATFNQRALQQVRRWLEQNWPDLELIADRIENY